jgi:tetratricopeptide (TPR) repeat protein
MPLVGIPEPPASTTPDVSEYTQALEVYCHKLRGGSIKAEEGAIQERLDRLEAEAWSATDQEKKTLIELFGFYQVLQAGMSVWNKHMAKASTILSSTIERARQEKLSHLFAHALTERAGILLGRFETTSDPGTLQIAVNDYQGALQERERLSPLYCGLLDIRRGLAEAYRARDNEEWTHALSVMRLGSSQVGFSPDDVRIVARLDSERYLLNRASAYLYSPMGKPALALSVLKELDDWCPEARGKGRLVQRNRLFAEAYLATGDYPMASAYLEAALESASRGEIDRLIEIHARLKNTPYWNHPDIGRLAVKINQMKYPGLLSFVR